MNITGISTKGMGTFQEYERRPPRYIAKNGLLGPETIRGTRNPGSTPPLLSGPSQWSFSPRDQGGKRGLIPCGFRWLQQRPIRAMHDYF
ncbi:hypothetical protein M0802_009372 [Mischocyttarus mexicanus]|nr:hypothetical protein M0802_009372 [Mischocyttarus mexicanus]